MTFLKKYFLSSGQEKSIFEKLFCFEGGSTILPALRSFCIFCAVGLLVVYVFQVTLSLVLLLFSCGLVKNKEIKIGKEPTYWRVIRARNSVNELLAFGFLFPWQSLLVLSIGALSVLVRTLFLYPSRLVMSWKYVTSPCPGLPLMLLGKICKGGREISDRNV